MANQPHDEAYERQMARRRRYNRFAILGIAVVLLVLVAFSPIPNAWIYLLLTYGVIGILLFARSIVEKRYKADAAALKEEEEAENKGEDS